MRRRGPRSFPPGPPPCPFKPPCARIRAANGQSQRPVRPSHRPPIPGRPNHPSPFRHHPTSTQLPRPWYQTNHRKSPKHPSLVLYRETGTSDPQMHRPKNHRRPHPPNGPSAVAQRRPGLPHHPSRHSPLPRRNGRTPGHSRGLTNLRSHLRHPPRPHRPHLPPPPGLSGEETGPAVLRPLPRPLHPQPHSLPHHPGLSAARNPGNNLRLRQNHPTLHNGHPHRINLTLLHGPSVAQNHHHNHPRQDHPILRSDHLRRPPLHRLRSTPWTAKVNIIDHRIGAIARTFSRSSRGPISI